MMRNLAVLTMVVLVAGCGGDDSPEFNAAAVERAIERSGRFETAQRADALESFRYTCVELPDISINEFSVHDLIVNADEYADEFVATARLGCPGRFAHVQDKIDNGDCFGGPLSGCD